MASSCQESSWRRKCTAAAIIGKLNARLWTAAYHGGGLELTWVGRQCPNLCPYCSRDWVAKPVVAKRVGLPASPRLHYFLKMCFHFCFNFRGWICTWLGRKPVSVGAARKWVKTRCNRGEWCAMLLPAENGATEAASPSLYMTVIVLLPEIQRLLDDGLIYVDICWVAYRILTLTSWWRLSYA